MITINDEVQLPDDEIQISAIRASGPGGQHVNKVASAVQLRFDVAGSSLPEAVRNILLTQLGSRLTIDGVLLLKARNHRSQERNRRAAIERLVSLLGEALIPVRERKPTRPSKASRARRSEEKKRRAGLKVGRRKPPLE